VRREKRDGQASRKRRASDRDTAVLVFHVGAG
jgi:hypothetical protein